MRHADGIKVVLRGLTFDDTRNIYEAIRVAKAGGLGRVQKADVQAEPPAELSVIDAMQLARDRDSVACQYCHGFADVFRMASWIEEDMVGGWTLDTAIVDAHVRQLALAPDSLILRKCGRDVAEQVRAMANKVLNAGMPGNDAYRRALEDFDFWLRADGHRRNPGTTADLIAAALFVLLREGRVQLKP
jgi:triphosphoribosyl-dephospho-CoA synthase